jgi:hypothetical protein
MAFRHGRWAEISVNSVPLSTFCDSADLSVDVDTASTTAFLSAWHTHVVGVAGGTVELTGHYDPTATTGPAAALAALILADPFPVLLYPGGNVEAQIVHSFDAILTAYRENSAVGDRVTFAATLLADGEIETSAVPGA